MDALRSALQPITHNLPTPIRNLGVSLLGPHCYQTLLHDIDPFADPACLKLAISKGLGIGIIGASSIVKIPQLLKLLNSQSSEGISFLSYALETSAYLIGLAYNVRQGFPFSTYGETALIAVQNIVIAALVLQFAGRTAGAAAWVAGLAAAGYALFDGKTVDAPTLSWLQAGAGVLGVFNYLAGSLSRIFTTLQEVDDPLILYGFVAGFILNAVLAAQMIYYWNSPKSKTMSSAKLEEPMRERPMAAASGTAHKPKSPSTRRRG
ncbi:hypothetical protein H2199_003773 [Coniosporium tulheliwenetii]|uniref:Uncharacterized protein n=1 Tax=Coniosporium tulheliwenetii TaxID=3383036 RepID=A0ACC2Z9J6_9PEZI|nr:hypothetical protein H2199_003773 [Cladosporium sp. JES 115]